VILSAESMGADGVSRCLGVSRDGCLCSRLVFIFGVLATITAASSCVTADDRGRFLLEEIEVKDGDTISGRIKLPWGISLTETIRAANYDAWEVSRARRAVEVTNSEIEKGKAARDYLKAIAAKQRIYATPQGGGQRDVYGRILAELWILRDNKWIDLATEMKANGHTRQSGAP